MSGKYSNYDWLPPTKNVLKAITSKGFIIIEKFPKMIIAKDHELKEVARTYKIDESGLKWLKNECKGWHDWNRLKWQVIEK